MDYQPLHHKYRPQNFAELVGQEAIATTLTNAIAKERIAPAYLFAGPRGTGKTSSARILAKSLNCLHSDRPTAKPCGVCEVCRTIASGSALDVIEIDAASNTGVDNIREIIEKSQFAPIQCRYKVYVIDECLSADALVLTSEGLIRIDNPDIREKKVLSYDESRQRWEFKKVLRWLERGRQETLVIKTIDTEVRCTPNHLIGTDAGWIPAKKVKPGTNILSPNHIGSNSWQTNLERVSSVKTAGVEKVYDLEVENNHNFVANGLLVHNCHMLTQAAFNALLKTLEEPPPKVVFILATTDLQRVLPTIISRCQRFDYRRISIVSMVSHLEYIASQENIDISQEAITLVAQIANGGLRDAQSLLEQLALLSGKITVERVWDLVGAVSESDLLALLKAIARREPVALLQRCRHLLDRGREPLVVLQNLANFYLNLLIAKTAPDRPEMAALSSVTWKELCEEANNWEMAEILRGQQHLKESEIQIKNTTQPRLWLEVTLLGLLSLPNEKQVSPPPQKLMEVRIAPPAKKPEPPSPTPIVVEEPAIAEPPTTVPSETSIELQIPQEKIWERVLDCLQPPFTQALVSAHCHLISFEGTIAFIGVKPQMLRHVQDRKRTEHLEEAFAKVCGKKVQIRLQAGDIVPPENNSSQKPKKELLFPAISNNLPKAPTIQSEVIEPKEPETSKVIAPDSSRRDETTAIPLKESQVSYPEDDLKKAAAIFAKAVDGEIVNLAETAAFGAGKEEPEVREDKSGEPTKITGRPDPNTYPPEEDIPF